MIMWEKKEETISWQIEKNDIRLTVRKVSNGYKVRLQNYMETSGWTSLVSALLEEDDIDRAKDLALIFLIDEVSRLERIAKTGLNGKGFQWEEHKGWAIPLYKLQNDKMRVQASQDSTGWIVVVQRIGFFSEWITTARKTYARDLEKEEVFLEAQKLISDEFERFKDAYVAMSDATNPDKVEL